MSDNIYYKSEKGQYFLKEIDFCSFLKLDESLLYLCLSSGYSIGDIFTFYSSSKNQKIGPYYKNSQEVFFTRGDFYTRLYIGKGGVKFYRAKHLSMDEIYLVLQSGLEGRKKKREPMNFTAFDGEVIVNVSRFLTKYHLGSKGFYNSLKEGLSYKEIEKKNLQLDEKGNLQVIDKLVTKTKDKNFTADLFPIYVEEIGLYLESVSDLKTRYGITDSNTVNSYLKRMSLKELIIKKENGNNFTYNGILMTAEDISKNNGLSVGDSRFLGEVYEGVLDDIAYNEGKINLWGTYVDLELYRRVVEPFRKQCRQKRSVFLNLFKSGVGSFKKVKYENFEMLKCVYNNNNLYYWKCILNEEIVYLSEKEVVETIISKCESKSQIC